MTDKQAFERIEEILKEVKEIAKEKNIRIDVYSNAKGDFSNADVGDYEILIIKGNISHEYRPLYSSEKWKSINPDQVNFSGEPYKESAPGGNPNAQIKNNTLKQ